MGSARLSDKVRVGWMIGNPPVGSLNFGPLYFPSLMIRLLPSATATVSAAGIILLVCLLPACGKKEPPPPVKPAPAPAEATPPPAPAPPAPPATPTAPLPSPPSPAPIPTPTVPPMPAPTPPAPAPAPLPPPSVPDTVPPEERLGEVRKLRTPGLTTQLRDAGFTLGDPIFIRVFKETLELELWIKPKSAPTYRKWKTWPIAAMSGELGPKNKQGDRQAPEGFYQVTAKSLNPRSSYHLSFNIGYPNALDLAHQRTGNFIMVHGKAVSIGCFAMTDPVIEEIYLMAEAALKKGQPAFAVHVFPFRMTSERLLQAGEEHPSLLPFWLDLRQGYNAFESTQQPPIIKVEEKRYRITPVGTPQPS